MSTCTSSSNDSEGSWVPSGAIYENVEYPLSFVLTGAGSASQWNMPTPLGLPDTKVLLQNNAVRFPTRFSFQRAAGETGAPAPLQDGVLVTITVRGVDESPPGVAVNWEEQYYPVPYDWEPTRFRSLVVAPYSPGASGGGETFIFSSIVQQGRTVINLTPAVVTVPYPDSEDEGGPRMIESTASLCLLPNTAAIPDAYHSVVWPVVSGGTPMYPEHFSEGFSGYPRAFTPPRPPANSIAQGSWVWARR